MGGAQRRWGGWSTGSVRYQECETAVPSGAAVSACTGASSQSARLSCSIPCVPNCAAAQFGSAISSSLFGISLGIALHGRYDKYRKRTSTWPLGQLDPPERSQPARYGNGDFFLYERIPTEEGMTGRFCVSLPNRLCVFSQRNVRPKHLPEKEIQKYSYNKFSYYSRRYRC